MSARIHRPAPGVAEIIIDRDIKRNALNAETVQAVTGAATQLQADPDLRVVVLKSEGTRAFSAGADIGELSALDATSAYGFIDALRGAIQAVADIPVPVICRIQGACIGGAMELAAACDLRIASNAATFCMPEVLVGIPSRDSSRPAAAPDGPRSRRLAGVIGRGHRCDHRRKLGLR